MSSASRFSEAAGTVVPRGMNDADASPHHGHGKITDIPLRTLDKQVAVEWLKKIMREQQQEREGL